ncbi:MAG: AAA family ATPase [Levilactobacillus sp.]|uniref:AAA family ATPase n=1 Tax=Levilactobacillus sp. TaxID=2767919 RepID=UPI0025846EDB|nr:AAA family ATPase [Levilactobacillus sp.]MCH4123429.1 AAA family ATPase [Levilactobacillus sp.]MCI1552433.1 AAA family ATPase [Levilactobacillus sp.]MCI1599020.1 AAA family ATPase [Levilactobacillus sp.]MCI1606064.1 AAA family ATPase [Levilactobacillus sp.]
MALTYQACLQATEVVLASGAVPTIVGEAGIGKSALVAELAQRRQAKLFTTVVSLVEKGDLVIPVPPLTSDSFVQTAQYGSLADVQFGYSHTLVAMVRYAEAHPDQEIIWFLDEFNRGTQAVQSELMNLVLQRQINTLTLPPQVHLILAENPDATMAGFEQSHYGVTPGDAAIADRTTRLILQADTPTWLTWATATVDGHPRIDPLVTTYLRDHPDDLQVTATANAVDDDLQPTPRAWERVSRAIRELTRQQLWGQTAVVTALMQGNLGVSVGSAFASALLRQHPGLTVEQAFSAPDAVTTLRALTPAQQQMILQNCLAAEDWPLTTATTAARFGELLAVCPPDGQFAIAQRLADQAHVLEDLDAVQAERPAVAQLYQQLTLIGKRSSEIEV